MYAYASRSDSSWSTICADANIRVEPIRGAGGGLDPEQRSARMGRQLDPILAEPLM
jgi:hypothetical protein